MYKNDGGAIIRQKKIFNIYTKQNGLNHFTLIQYELNFMKTNKTLEFMSCPVMNIKMNLFENR